MASRWHGGLGTSSCKAALNTDGCTLMEYFCRLSVAHGLHLPLCDPVQRHSMLILPSCNTWLNYLADSTQFCVLCTFINNQPHVPSAHRGHLQQEQQLHDCSSATDNLLVLNSPVLVAFTRHAHALFLCFCLGI